MNARALLPLVALGGLALGASVMGAPAAPPPPLAGDWNVQVPGQPPTPAGVLSLRRAGGAALTGTFTPPGGRAEPLAGVRATNERLRFRFTLSTGRQAGRTFTGRITPTLDADAWTGRLSGPGGSLAVDLVRRPVSGCGHLLQQSSCPLHLAGSGL